jgi:hypothetical protein
MPAEASSPVVTVDLTTGLWAKVAFAAAGRGPDPAPDSCSGDEGQVEGSSKMPQTRVTRSPVFNGIFPFSGKEKTGRQIDPFLNTAVFHN